MTYLRQKYIKNYNYISERLEINKNNHNSKNTSKCDINNSHLIYLIYFQLIL